MARVLKGSHSFTCTPRVRPQRKSQRANHYARPPVKDQDHRVKTSCDRQIINALLQEIGVAESNGDVGILIESCEIAVRAHAQYKIGPKQRIDWRDVGRPQVAMHS